MNLSWNLQELFLSDEAFYEEITKIKEEIKEFKESTPENLDKESLYSLLEEKWLIKERANTILLYGSLKYYKNIKDEKCSKLKQDAEIFSNEVNTELSFVDRMILNLGESKVEDFMRQNSALQKYAHALNNLFRMKKHVEDEATTKNIAKNMEGINHELKRYNDTLRDIKCGSIEVDGKTIEITLSNFAKYITSRDQETRRKTYLTVNQSFANEAATFADILNNIYTYRDKNARLEQYSSVLEKVLFEENIDERIIDTLIETVNHSVSIFQDYLQIKADLLEIKEPHLYDFSVPLIENSHKTYSLEEVIDIIKKALEPLGEEYLKVVDTLLDGHIDAMPAEEKHQSIIFSWHTYSFMNFHGAYGDIKNLIHELGHIVNYYLSMKNQPFIYEDSTIFVGETASLVNEILLNRYLFENATTKEEKLYFLSKEIENYFTSVFKQTLYTEFERTLYQLKENQNLTPELLSKAYFDHIKKYYGDHIVYDNEASVEWTRLGHLYRHSYYPYKYATGLIMASVVVNDLMNDQNDFKEKYLSFLESGSSKYSLELLKMINVDLTDHTIIRNGLKIVEEDVLALKRLMK